MTKIWAYITGALLALVGILGALLKIRGDQYKKARHEVKTHEKAREIRKDQGEAITEIKQTEQDRIETHTKPDSRSRADRINSVLNDRNNT